jgi:hypothetical protein
MPKFCSSFCKMLAMQPIINLMIQALLATQRGPEDAEGPLVQHALNRVNRKRDAHTLPRIKKPRGAGLPKASRHE